LDLTLLDFAGFAKNAIAQPQETAIAEMNSEVCKPRTNCFLSAMSEPKRATPKTLPI
jgi:hypothetical protein